MLFTKYLSAILLLSAGAVLASDKHGYIGEFPSTDPHCKTQNPRDHAEKVTKDCQPFTIQNTTSNIGECIQLSPALRWNPSSDICWFHSGIHWGKYDLLRVYTDSGCNGLKEIESGISPSRVGEHWLCLQAGGFFRECERGNGAGCWASFYEHNSDGAKWRGAARHVNELLILSMAAAQWCGSRVSLWWRVLFVDRILKSGWGVLD